MPDGASRKRTVGLALFGSSGIVTLIAMLVYLSVIDLGESIRPVVIGVLAITAIVDVIVGWRFLSASNE